MKPPRVELPLDTIAAFCERHGIVRLAVFGSLLREDFNRHSDVDVLVNFAPGRTPGLSFFSMQAELSGIIGREADLHTPGSLAPHFRDEVLRTAEVIHEAA